MTTSYTLEWPREVDAATQDQFSRACWDLWRVVAMWPNAWTTELVGAPDDVQGIAAMYRAAGAMLRVEPARVGEA
jgi:hypothetical protein